MSLSFCLILLAAALACRHFGAARQALWLAATGFALMILIGIGIVPALQLSATQLDSPLPAVTWRDKNTIVVLGAGTVARSKTSGPDVPVYGYGRIVMAASAYNDCRAHGKDCHIIVSGGDPEHHGAAEATVYGATLLALGVPQSAVTLETQSRNTWQNAAFSTRLIPTDRQIVVVTSGIHLRRALIFFEHFRTGAEGIAADRLAPSIGPLQMGYNFFVADALLHEEIGLLEYHVYNALGWNKRQPG
jgi:uncharacterized SAM-binding protein YcdF (DUF218 family)